MSDRIELMTHIDIRVVRNLLSTRLNEGRDMMKLASTPSEWRQSEKKFQDKCREALRLIDEAIMIKEGKVNEVSNDSTKNQNSSESNPNSKQGTVQTSKS